METITESPSTSELFDSPSPEQEAKASPSQEVEEKVEEKAVEETSEEGKEKPEEKESESKEKSEDETSSDSQEKPSTDTDKEESTVESQLKEARKWGNEKNQEALNYQKELKRIKEENGITDEPIDNEEAKARLDERINISDQIERDRHGDEFIEKTIYAEDSIWQKVKYDPVIDFRVKNSLSPITEALKVVKEQEFHEEYGNDPEKIISKVKSELTVELKKELKKEFEDKLKQKKGLGSDLSNVKNDEVTEAKGHKNPSTKELFG